MRTAVRLWATGVRYAILYRGTVLSRLRIPRYYRYGYRLLRGVTVRLPLRPAITVTAIRISYPYYGYAYAAPGYVVPGSAAQRDVRIRGAAHAEVYVDGTYAGVVDNYDGTFQRLDLGPGSHEVEVRTPGGKPLTYDVNVNAGQTVTLHANIR
jgi:hypothetical protein